MDNDNKREIDEFSGVETTGHEWDGLKELNNPLPRWWLWVFYATCLWSAWYFVVYPAWPTLSGATSGTSGYTQYKELAASQDEIIQRQQAYLQRFEAASFDEVLSDPALYAFANAGGAAAFKDNCATCHGSGAAGFPGYPNLNDDDWLWGGRVEDIYTTLLHGIRVAGDFDTRQSQMPAFGADGLLTREEINQTVDYVIAMAGGEAYTDMQGHVIFQENCASCHGEQGQGLYEFGAPNLRDAIWLYGSERKDIYKSIFYSRAGMMPAWKDRLDDNTIRQLSVYVHQLGGGEESVVNTPEPVTPAIEMPSAPVYETISYEESTADQESEPLIQTPQDALTTDTQMPEAPQADLTEVMEDQPVSPDNGESMMTMPSPTPAESEIGDEL